MSEHYDIHGFDARPTEEAVLAAFHEHEAAMLEDVEKSGVISETIQTHFSVGPHILIAEFDWMQYRFTRIIDIDMVGMDAHFIGRKRRPDRIIELP